MSDITQKAMLVRLNIRQWSARKHDRRVSNEVADSHGADRDSGRYNKNLVAKTALAEISTLAWAMRTDHYAQTLPWLDEGYRILPAANYFEYQQRQQATRVKFEAAVTRFAADYPSYVEDARRRLNGLFNQDDYPSEHEIAARFGVDANVVPLPDRDDFRVSLGAEEESRIRADIEQRLNDATHAAMADLWQRVHDAVSHMAERLRAYTGSREGSFRDSLVDNLRELVDVLPRLNVTGDARLDEVARRLAAECCSIDAQVLRDIPQHREAVARSAETILRDINEFLA